MTTVTGHGARDKIEQLIEDAAESHVPVTIIGKRHDAVLISAEDWAAIQTTLGPAQDTEKDEFVAPGFAAREEAQFSGDYVDPEDVSGEWHGMPAESATTSKASGPR
jgi:PHD/YefM family antitoxin component YafN of YafNO toxin-antitoxin module